MTILWLRQRVCRPITGAVLLLALFGCKTTGSDAQASLGSNMQDLSLTDWTRLCEDELASPERGAQAKKDLMALAKTTDCAAAYPAVKQAWTQSSESLRIH